MMYTCPVCGNNQMDEPPENYTICDCCGTEFGYHDFTRSHAELREQWRQRGAKWKSVDYPAPPNWSAIEQLINIFSTLTGEDKRFIARSHSVGGITVITQRSHAANVGSPIWTLNVPPKQHYVHQICAGV